jgi:hypothetical protein
MSYIVILMSFQTIYSINYDVALIYTRCESGHKELLSINAQKIHTWSFTLSFLFRLSLCLDNKFQKLIEEKLT